MKTILMKTSSNKEKTMEKVKQVWKWAKAHPQTSIIAVVVVIVIYFLVN